MTRSYEYTSGLSAQIQAFIREKRALGCKYEKEAKVFREMDRFLVEQGVVTPVLTQDVVEKWVEKRPNEKRKNQRWRLNFTKRFVSYLLLHRYEAYYPEYTISSSDIYFYQRGNSLPHRLFQQHETESQLSQRSYRDPNAVPNPHMLWVKIR